MEKSLDTPPPSPACEGGCRDSSLALPRIVCLHGGGTNARIFHAQCRALRTHLKDSFRLVFVDAPFPSSPGPDVEFVYGEWGPFRSWLRAPKKLDLSRVDACIEDAMSADDQAGATGRWVGLMGFSQGASVAASLLLRQQHRMNQSCASTIEKDGRPRADYRFAVLMAGRPLSVLMDTGNDEFEVDEAGLLQLPTVHVHGLRDPGLELHRALLRQCSRKSKPRLVEWNGGHRVPITRKDVTPVVDAIDEVAHECGVWDKIHLSYSGDTLYEAVLVG